jgi:hypothetical protein
MTWLDYNIFFFAISVDFGDAFYVAKVVLPLEPVGFSN